ncbi:MAG: hypothetical protein JW726_08255 [Anaerolineales bacterium]|nr:hypothetical protein [Anaerolineales bacterium]
MWRQRTSLHEYTNRADMNGSGEGVEWSGRVATQTRADAVRPYIAERQHGGGRGGGEGWAEDEVMG